MALSVDDVRALAQIPTVSDDDINELLPYAKTQFAVDTGVTYSDTNDQHNLAVLYYTAYLLLPKGEREMFLARYDAVRQALTPTGTDETSAFIFHRTGDTSW